MAVLSTLALLLVGSNAGVPQQIHWQRSLDDARAIAMAEHRPILLAVNMDGESASERIVRENYREPAFVAATRSFVCVVSSVFRHTPRDHDDEGRRIPCPRLSEITCGEHIALEPAVYAAFLGGERIAPRHALIQTDGSKSFDLFLLFDLRELDRALVLAAQAAPPPVAERALPAGDLEDLASMAGTREHHARLAFEERLFDARSEASVLAALDAIRAHGDAGSIGALRILLARASGASASSEVFARGWTQAAQELQLAAPAADLVRERIQSLGRFPGAVGLDEGARLLPMLAELAPEAAATRSLVLGYLTAGDADDRRAARRALDPLLGSAQIGEVERALQREGGEFDLRALLAAESTEAVAPVAKKILRPAADLEREIEHLDRTISDRPQDLELHARYGRAALELAQVRMETGDSGAQLLLEDADRWLASAAQPRSDDVDVVLDRARAAFLLARFEDEERFGIEALRITERAPPAARASIEARRWIGDAAGRLIVARSGGDPAIEAAGLARAARHLATVAASPFADETDWQSLISVFGAIGMRREELACAQAGALRLPESSVLRQVLNDALWLGGRIDLAPAKAEWIAARHPRNAACVWFAGYAHILAAEDLRREEQADRAIQAYRTADERFVHSVALEVEFADSASHYRALAALGRGFAHLLADRRKEASGELVAAIAIRPAVADARDGLDREAVDLLDGALEWRQSGPSPVAPLELLGGLERADPKNAEWARRIADSELREALRADGRGPVTLGREIVRDGRTVRVDVPVPTQEGDDYLRTSMLAARRALEHGDTPENRRLLAQSATVFAERLLDRGEGAQARELLAEAAPLLEEEPPAQDASLEALGQVAARLRRELGAARPLFRPGR